MAEMGLPDIDLEGRVVIMTRADRGLGRAMRTEAPGRTALCHCFITNFIPKERVLRP